VDLLRVHLLDLLLDLADQVRAASHIARITSNRVGIPILQKV
jgi:hypothetical protein